MLLIIFICCWFDWKTLKSENFTIIYKPEYYWESIQALNNLEYYRKDVVELTGNDTRNVPFVIEDVGTTSNGFANPLFYNIHIFTYPPAFGSSLASIENWYRAVGVHEYIHIAHLTKVRGFPKILSNIFGFPFQSNMYSPGWIVEGITVFGESQMSRYEGRLNDGFFDHYIGTRVYEQKFPSIIEATNMPMEFPFGAIYLYGGEFFDFLAQRYGKESFRRFFGQYGSYFWSPLSAILPFTGLDLAAKKVYGKSFPKLFIDWQRYEEHRFANWQPEGDRITKKGWYVYSLTKNSEKLYYVRAYPVKLDAFFDKMLINIIELNPVTHQERIVASINSSITTPMRTFDNKIYYTTLDLKRGQENVYLNGFGVTSNLHRIDLSTGRDEVLFTDDIRSFCVLPGAEILYSKDKLHSFGSEVWLYTGQDKRMLFESDYIIGELDADSNYVIAVARPDYENWNIYYIDDESYTLIPIVETPWIEGHVNLNLTGDELLFTANYNEIYGIFIYDLIDGKICRLTKNGYADQGITINDTLYFIGQTKDGFDIYKKGIELEEYKLEGHKSKPLPNILMNEIEIKEGGYGDVLKTLMPALRMPVFLPVDEHFQKWTYGIILAGGDATNENIYATYVGRDPVADRPVFSFFWQSILFRPLNFEILYDYKDMANYTISYPIILNLKPGLSNLNIFLDGRAFDDFSRKEFSPGIAMRFSYPYTSIYARFTFPYERRAWKSTIHRNGQYFWGGIRQILWSGECRLWASAYLDVHNPDTPSVHIRGYQPIESPRTLLLQAEYAHRLVKIRQGLWNPNIYLEDLYWVAFFDVGFVDGGDAHYSMGCEIKLETKTGFGFLQFVPKIGFAYTKDRKLEVFLGIYPSFSF